VPIPTKPTRHSNAKPTTRSDPKPAMIPISSGSCRGDCDGEAQEAPHLHRLTGQTLEWRAARIVKHQQDPIAAAYEFERFHRPCRIQFNPQFVLVVEAIENRRRRAFRRRRNEQHGVPFAIFAEYADLKGIHERSPALGKVN
jgi:hypothetical protein